MSFMNKEDKHIRQLQGLLAKYDLLSPASPEDKSQIRRSTRRNLTVILRKSGRYGLFTGIALSLYWHLKRFGFSYVASKLITVIIIALISISMMFGFYFLVIYIFDINTPDVRQINSKKEIISHTNEADKDEIASVNQIIKSQKIYMQKPKAVINKFWFYNFYTDSPTVKNDLLLTIKNKITRECNFIKKKNIVANDGAHIKYIVRGSVNTLGENLVINIKILDMQTTKLIYSFIENGTDIDTMCKTLAEKIVRAHEQLY